MRHNRQTLDVASDPEPRPTMTSRDDPFFLVGGDRSGTTMFRLMLNRHSRLNVPRETWFLIDLMDALPMKSPLGDEQKQRAYDIISRHRRWKEWELDDGRLAAAIGGLESPTLAQLVDAVYALTSDAKSRWGDKTPGYVTETSRLHTVFPTAQFIHLIRDGRDVCMSLRRTGWRGDVTWSIGSYWSKHVGAGCDQGRALPAGLYMEVAYEALVLHTEATLRRVCEFLGEEFEPQMLKFYEDAEEHIPEPAQSFHLKTKRPPRSSDVQRWRREMSWLQVFIFETAASGAMRCVGYTPHFRYSLVPARWAFAAIAWLASFTLPLRRRLGLHFPALRQRL